MFNNPYTIALVVPIILLVSGAFAKKLVRGSSWQRSDFYLGVEFALAAMTSALIYIFDLVGRQTGTGGTNSIDPNKIVAAAVFLAFCFFLLLWILSTHQDWERRDHNPRGQIVWLCIIVNAVGAGLLVVFILTVKGV